MSDEDQIRRCFKAFGYFRWGKDEWIHTDDLETTLTTEEVVREIGAQLRNLYPAMALMLEKMGLPAIGGE